MTVFVDPDVPASLLRQGIYDGDVVILTNLSSVAGSGRLHAGAAYRSLPAL